MVRAFGDRPLAAGRTSSGSWTRAGTPAAPRTSSAGTSSSSRSASSSAAVGRRAFAGHVAGAAAAVALVTPDPTRPGASLSLVWDLGLAAENMMLAAWELGDRQLPGDGLRPAMAREMLGYPDDRWCGYVLSFGYPADPDDLTGRRAGGRRPLDEIVHRERW